MFGLDKKVFVGLTILFFIALYVGHKIADEQEKIDAFEEDIDNE